MVPNIIDIASAVPGVDHINDVRARWVGHTLHITMNIEVDAQMTLEKAHAIAEEVRHRLFHDINGVSEVIIHTDPHGHDVDPHALTAHHMQQSQRPVAQR
jgi:divalent metal cation (Fe/Co/Zn/Cd) transporter